MNPRYIINKYYSDNAELEILLVKHSLSVANKALAIAKQHPEWDVDLQFIEEAAMLHDIGIFQTDAPGIHCYGNEPYITHGTIGAELLRAEGFPKHARVAERHTGAGLSARDIREQKLPLPAKDLLPETLEEKIICYADKFFSKSHPEAEKTIEQVRHSMHKFGLDTELRFEELHRLMNTI